MLAIARVSNRRAREMRNRSQPTTLRDQDPSGRRIGEDIQKAYEVLETDLIGFVGQRLVASDVFDHSR